VPPEAQEALRILKTIHKDLFTSECVVGSGGKSVGYLAHGTATDYMFERLKVPMAYTWEIYGDMKAPFSDCFRMFNPLTQEHVD
ncbi:peptidase_M14 domain-containing protein, partial [Haematococcus lacustris]